MSYSGYLYYSSQDTLGEPASKYNLLNSPKFKDVEAGNCQSCKKKLASDDVEKKVNMGVPYVMLMVSLVQIMVFFSHKGANSLCFDPNKRYEIWRYLTYMLVHADCYHLASNILLQLVAGIIIEQDQKWWRAALVYLGGGIGGSLASLDQTIIVGASSGAYALFFSQIPQVLLNHKTLKYLKSRVAYLIICIIGGSIHEAYMVLRFDPTLSEPYQIAFHSHVAGLVAGVTIGFVLYKENNKVVKYTFSFALFYMAIIGIIYNIYRQLPMDAV